MARDVTAAEVAEMLLEMDLSIDNNLDAAEIVAGICANEKIMRNTFGDKIVDAALKIREAGRWVREGWQWIWGNSDKPRRTIGCAEAKAALAEMKKDRIDWRDVRVEIGQPMPVTLTPPDPDTPTGDSPSSEGTTELIAMAGKAYLAYKLFGG